MYYGYGYGYDSMYFLVLLAFIFSMVAQMKVSGTFKKYAKIRNRRGLTGLRALCLTSRGCNRSCRICSARNIPPAKQDFATFRVAFRGLT